MLRSIDRYNLKSDVKKMHTSLLNPTKNADIYTDSCFSILASWWPRDICHTANIIGLQSTTQLFNFLATKGHFALARLYSVYTNPTFALIIDIIPRVCWYMGKHMVRTIYNAQIRMFPKTWSCSRTCMHATFRLPISYMAGSGCSAPFYSPNACT